MPRESEVEAASEMLQRERAEAEERSAACSVRALDAALSPEPRERREARLPLLCPPALPALPGRPAPQPGSGVSAESHSSGASPEKPAGDSLVQLFQLIQVTKMSKRRSICRFGLGLVSNVSRLGLPGCISE